ncbi:hypothetical protein DPMN_185692 [Dreissena polymorpha]|uniref:Uncharacterized protein n=1 Tax=Dreissena polymorpha TaxID=45954 RepID=A0A9D4DP25_DREPO|nr:hypothetical protein DPMN_185692 [Dreissena polymorpha]
MTLVVAIVLTDGQEKLVKSTATMAATMSMTGQNVTVIRVGPVHIVTRKVCTGLTPKQVF